MSQKINIYFFHPFLFLIYFVIFIYNQNYDDLSANSDILWAVFVLILITICIYYIINIFIDNLGITGIILTPFLFIFFSCGGFFKFLSEYFSKSNMRLLILIGSNAFILLNYILFCYIILKYWNIKTIEIINKIFSLSIILLISFNSVELFLNNLKQEKRPFLNKGDCISLKPKIINPPPDIYYIILDAYASLDTIKKVYDYDNKEFAVNIQKKGFYIATKSKTNFMNTKTSLASSLNMDKKITRKEKQYDIISGRSSSSSIAEQFGLENPTEYYYNDKIRNNKVIKILKCNGYKYIHFGPRWYGTRYNKNADLNYYCSGLRLKNELMNLIIESSIIRLGLSNRIPFINGGHREGILYEFKQLERIIKIKGPKFVFAHVLCPHVPFVFGPKGESIKFKDSVNWQDKSIYLGQHIFITKKVEKLIYEIISQSEYPPIVVVQSDHGIEGKGNIDALKSIFNAYYLPYGGDKILWPSISPFETFPLIFNYYFKTVISG